MPTTEDSADEKDERLTLHLSNPQGATLDGARVAQAPSRTTTIRRLTASFSNVLPEHDGSEFVFDLDFSEYPELSYPTRKGGGLRVANGTVLKA